MGMNVVLYVEKRRRSVRWHLVDPPSASAYGAGWDLARGAGLAHFLAMLGDDSAKGSVYPMAGCPTDLQPELIEDLHTRPSKLSWWILLSPLLAAVQEGRPAFHVGPG